MENLQRDNETASIAATQASPWVGLRTHWQVIAAATAGWALDAFDFAMLLFLLPHLQKVFDVGLPAMTLIVTATGLAKIVGTIGWGMAADRFGRKLVFMAAVLWFSCAAGLSGLAWSYASFMVMRVLFGVGFGGEWTVSVSLVMETVPESIRPYASGIMVSGYEIGYMVAAGVFHLLFPVLGWRWMFVIGALPALLTLFIRKNIAESPEWLRERRERPQRKRFDAFEFNPAAVQAWLFSGAINFMLWSVQVLYPTFLMSARHIDASRIYPFLAAYSVGSISGKPICGYVAARLGERRTIVLFLCMVIPLTILYTLMSNLWLLALGAILMGLFASGLFGILPLYQSMRFSVRGRATGIGISYAMTAASSVAPYAIARLAPSIGLNVAIAAFIGGSAVLLMAIASWNTNRWKPGREHDNRGPEATDRPSAHTLSEARAPLQGA
ncbi:MFS transporter [Caballeronia sp. LZ065]|uniref:MFS transporter n=1 Tax=Caballeronia sp. LZ065 TaxID=3038571 RepID=UPI002864A43E|nr:MFS transporter [Caballeronia sp. LZ065]MDR5781386.1 MFS transporter [Caballeronia sp. LZ065]